MRNSHLLIGCLTLLCAVFLAGCIEQSGAVIASENTVSATPAPSVDSQNLNNLLAKDSLIAFPGEKASATALPSASAPAPSATPTATPTPKPTATPTPTPTPTPSFTVPGPLSDSSAPSNVIEFVCAKQGPSCDEVVANIFTTAPAAYYVPTNTEHAKMTQYYFLTTDALQRATGTMLQFCARYYPKDNAFAIYGYSTGFKQTC